MTHVVVVPDNIRELASIAAIAAKVHRRLEVMRIIPSLSACNCGMIEATEGSMPTTVVRIQKANSTGGQRPGRGSGVRSTDASNAIGPIGFVINTPSVARVLVAFTEDPAKPRALGELLVTVGGTKGTIQAALRTLQKARIIHREGRGPKTTYRYAMDDALGKAMLKIVELSRQSLEPEEARSSIPWLSRFTSKTERRPLRFHADRSEPEVSQEAAERVLLAAEPVEGHDQKRTRQGFAKRG